MEHKVKLELNEFVVNPLTNKKIKATGKLAQKLRRDGILPADEQTAKNRYGHNGLVINKVAYDQEVSNEEIIGKHKNKYVINFTKSDTKEIFFTQGVLKHNLAKGLIGVAQVSSNQDELLINQAFSDNCEGTELLKRANLLAILLALKLVKRTGAQIYVADEHLLDEIKYSEQNLDLIEPIRKIGKKLSIDFCYQNPHTS